MIFNAELFIIIMLLIKSTISKRVNNKNFKKQSKYTATCAFHNVRTHDESTYEMKKALSDEGMQ